jgi:xanthine dehydrogenase accessory factor
MTRTHETAFDDALPVADADWPAFGWIEDVRPALGAAFEAGRGVALATLYRVVGSSPRGPGAQMLFDGARAVGYFSGGCVEADVARHAAEVMADGAPRRLHYGVGSPWLDIKLRCGGAIYIFVERIDADSAAARALLAADEARRPVLWMSDGRAARTAAAGDAALLTWTDDPLAICRRYDPRARLIVSGWDPTAMAIAKLGVEAQLETYLVRPDGPDAAPPIQGLTYVRASAEAAIARIGVDAWTAFVGATHESERDLPACAAALNAGAGYVGLVGAASRVPERTEAIIAAGAPREALSRLRAPAGVRSLGKAPWRIAIGIVAEILQTISADQARA